MNRQLKRILCLALSLLFLLPSAALAAEEDEDTSYRVSDIYATPMASNGHLSFGKDPIYGPLYLSTGARTETQATMSIAEAMDMACRAAMGVGLRSVSYLTVSPTQGTLYDGYLSEGDTGAGVAGANRYFYGADALANYHLEDVLFVPKGTFSGRATVTYYGYTDEDAPKTFAGRVYIEVGTQEPGISYSTDGEAVRFSSEDFAAYSLAVTGRTFRFVSFDLPNATYGTLYYNYIDEDTYDTAVTTGARYYRGTSPQVDNVAFVPKAGYSGRFLLGFNGVDISGEPFSGLMTVNVTAYGPNHPQNASGPFVYNVQSGRPVTLDRSDFDEETKSRTASNFLSFRLVSLPDAKSGVLYDDTVSSGAGHYAVADKPNYYPEKIRFAAASGYTGVVSVPIIVTSAGGSSYDSVLRFVVSDGVEGRLHYTADPEKRSYFVATDFSDACFEATGRRLRFIRFDSLPPTSQGGLYYKLTDPVRLNRDYSYTLLEDVDDNGNPALSFLASSTFSGRLEIPFTGYANGYTSSTRNSSYSFSGKVVLETSSSAAAASENVRPIGGAPSALTYSTNGVAVKLSGEAMANAAAASLPRPIISITLSRPDSSEGRLYSDFVSLTQKNSFDSTKPHSQAEISQVSFVPKAGFSGVSRMSYTVRDGGGNSFTGSVAITVTPPTQSAYFRDMGNAAWAVPAVDFFYHYGAANGTAAGSFGPNEGMRRGDFILLLSRAFSFPASGSPAGFDDVPETSYYAAAIAAARDAGILSDADGYLFYAPVTPVPDPPYNPDGSIAPADGAESADGAGAAGGADTAEGTDGADGAGATDAADTPTEAAQLVERYESRLCFYPADTITRQDAAVFLYRAMRRAGNLEIGGAADLAEFVDVGEIKPDAVEAMGTLVRLGILNGAYNRLNPQFPLTRAATMKLLYYALT